MSAMNREVRRRCASCGKMVVFRYDASGSSRAFEVRASGPGDTTPVAAVPHACSEPRDRHVGGLVPHVKTPIPETK